jgi:biotin carboxyl carrier protein
VRFTVSLGGREYRVDFDEAYGGRTLKVDGQEHRLTLLRVDGDLVRFTVDDRPVDAVVTGRLPDLSIDVGGGALAVSVEESRYADVRKISGLEVRRRSISDLKAPMPGLITRVLVQAGDRVKPGTPLLVMEAMKMENELRAQGDGRVKDVMVQPKQPVEQGQVLVAFASDGVGD